MRRFLRQLAADCRGATIVEFAMITPALLLTLMGLFDMAHNMYTAQMLNGAIQQAARHLNRFAQIVEERRAARGAQFSICDITLPAQISN